MLAAVGSEDLEAYAEHDINFHRIILEASQNGVPGELLNQAATATNVEDGVVFLDARRLSRTRNIVRGMFAERHSDFNYCPPRPPG